MVDTAKKSLPRQRLVHLHPTVLIFKRHIRYEVHLGVASLPSKSLFLTQSVNTDANELESILQTRLKQKLQTYSIKHFNMLSYFSCANDGPLEIIVDIAWNIQNFAKNMDNEMEHSFNSVFHTSNDKSILAYILLCVVDLPKDVPGN